MSYRRSIKGSQSKARVIALRVDGSAVGTTAGTAGLDEGAFDVTILKGTSGTANEVTVTFNKPFARAPLIVATPITTGVHVEVKSRSTTGCVLETFAVSDGTTLANDTDMDVFIMGWDSANQYGS